MTLPIIVSVPHAGLEVPPEVAEQSILTPAEIAADGDVGAAEIYAISEHAQHFVTASIARAFVDLNRAEDDIRADGVVKTHTCWNEPVYREPLAADLVETLLERYHRPYHRRLTELAAGDAILGVDCHTMAEDGPPVGPDPGQRRPMVCLGDGDGACPPHWARLLADGFEQFFPGDVTINRPFRGGYITRKHGAEMSWVQIELSRATSVTVERKREAVLAALDHWWQAVQKNRRTR